MRRVLRRLPDDSIGSASGIPIKPLRLSGACIVKWWPKVVLILLFVVAMIARAQSPTNERGRAQETAVREYWVDPSTGLMWAGKDNGKDVSWKKAVKYCRDLRLAGYSDWRLAALGELERVFDKNVNTPGENPRSRWHDAEPMNFHVKGGLFLTGNQWS